MTPLYKYAGEVIFLIKHRWQAAVLFSILVGGTSWLLGGWVTLRADNLPLPYQVGLGVLAGGFSLAIDGSLHFTFERLAGRQYQQAFFRHAFRVHGAMGASEYLAAGAMAAVAEEPLFRGVLLPWVDAAPAAQVAAAALAFAACHWLRRNHFMFSLWACWEGIFFGALMVLSGSVLVPMLAHGVHDALAYPALRRLLLRAEAEAAARTWSNS